MNVPKNIIHSLQAVERLYTVVMCG